MHILLTTVLGLLFSLAIAEDKPAPAADQDQLQGLWQAVSMESGGQAAPADQTRKFQLHFKSGKVVFSPKADNREHTFEINAAGKPKTLDIIPGDGAKKGAKLPCAIYELSGDKLTFCINKEMTGGKRPTEFKTAAGDGLVLIKLERVKVDK